MFGSWIYLMYGFDIIGIMIKIRGYNEDGCILKWFCLVGILFLGSWGNIGYIVICFLCIDYIFYLFGIYILVVIIEYICFLYYKVICYLFIFFMSGVIGWYFE